MDSISCEKNEATSVPTSQTPMSKNQLKKLAKRQKWLETKPQRRQKNKLKRKLKLQQARERGEELGPSRKFLKSNKMSDSTCKLRVCFDLSLASEMTDDEFSKTFKQLHRCYSLNRRAMAPLQLHITGYSESTKERMPLSSGCFSWDINFNPLFHSEIFKKEEIVYLTSDSPNVLNELDHDKVYIIGALVDHNRLKNICYEKAVECGIPHAQLPLDLYFKFKTRKVLTIDQVFMILLRVTEGKSWIDAVMEIVPKRKGVELKEVDLIDNSNSSNNDDQPQVNESVNLEDAVKEKVLEKCLTTDDQPDTCSSDLLK